MIASLRIALTYISFVRRQMLMMGIGLAVQVLAGSSFSLGGRTPLFTFSGLFLVTMPALAGGLAMRSCSTPTALHLYPRSRLPFLTGATATITCLAALMALPLFLRQIAGIDVPAGAANLANPGSGMFQVMWGSAALIWVVGFALSHHRLLPPLGLMALVVISNEILGFAERLSITADQLASGVFMAGIATWTVFATWYLRTPSVERPRWISEWANGDGLSVLTELGALRAIWHRAPTNSRTGSSTALRHYLLGADSMVPYLLAGLIVVALLALEHRVTAVGTGMTLPRAGLFLLAALGCACGSLIVQRSRLLWLRAALDRGALFVTVERQALRATLVITALPVLILIVMTLVHWPDQILNTLLFIALQLAIVGCSAYVGLSVTRGWDAEAIGFAIVLFMPTSVASAFLAPPRHVPAWAFLVATAAVGAVAIALRRSARRAWLEMDWRLTGPAIAQGLK
jgi:hypothetical protein